MTVRFIFFVIFSPIALFSQEFSKLEFFRSESKKNNTEEKQFEIQQNLVSIYRIYNPDSCFFYAQKNLQLINKNNWNAKKGKVLLGFVSYFTEKNKINQGFRYNKESLLINQKNKDDYSLADNYYMFGRLFHQKGEHTDAVANYLKAIDYGKKSNNLWIVSGAYRSLAFLYLDESNKEKVYENINNALKIAKQSKSKEALGFSYGVLAEIERSLGNPKEAEKHFNTSYQYFKNTQNEYGQAWLYTNWSLLDVSQLMESYQMQLKAQKIWDEISPNHYMSVANHYNLAYSYMDFYKFYEKYKGQLPYKKSEFLHKAQEEFDISKNIAQKNNNKQWVMFNYLGMSELSMLKRDLDGYAKNTTDYYTIKDSIYSQKRKNEIAKLESRKEVEKKNKEIALGKIIIKNKEKEKIYYLLGLTALLVIGLLMFFLYRQSKKNSNRLEKLNQDLDIANKTKMQFFGILNHDLRSPVAGLIHFLHLQKEAPELMDEETKNRLEAKTMNASEKLLQQMEDLLLWSKGQMDHFSPEIKKIQVKHIFEDIQNNFSWTDEVVFNFDFPENMIVSTDLEYLKTVTRNLTNNSVKVLDEKEGEKIISWKAWEDEKYSYLKIADNGSGASKEKFKALFDDSVAVGTKRGLGLHLIRDLCKAINMEVEVKTSEGFGSEITLKTKKV